MPVSKLVGAKVKRREDPRLIRGLGQYVDDINLPNTLHVAILRSPHAHARIKSIETDAARRHPGVVAVVTGAEIKDQIGTLPTSGGNETLRVPKHYVLAVDKVCHVGEGIAAVVAEERYTAPDALDLIRVEYEPLPVVSDPEKALAPGSPVIHSEWPDNVAFRSDLKHGNLAKAFKEADKIITQRLVHQRLAPIAIEPRGVLAHYLSSDKELTVWSSTQIPHMLKSHLSQMLKLSEKQVRVIAPEVGGGFSNKMSTDAYRGAGRPEATYVIERMVDRIAQELRIDSVKVRKKNFPKPAEFPFKTATGVAYDSGNYQPALNKALKIVGYEKLRRDQKRFRSQRRYLGIGLSTYVEICAMGPKGMWEYGKVEVEPTGKVRALSGASPPGQRQETSFAQIVADQLGVEMDDTMVIHGDTAAVAKGIGTFGSRATAVGGIAIYQAAEKVKEKARELASHFLEVDADDLVFSDGRFSVKGVPKKGLTVQQIAQEAHRAKNLPKRMEPRLSAESTFEPSNFTFPFGTHICVVEVEPQTGKIGIKKYVAVDDCGKVINPLLVDGQIKGGIVQGLGQALYEEVVYDENGQLLTGSLMNYALPRAADLPRLNLTRTETPTPVNPLGIKGIGEAGTIGSTPAVVNAVVDALAPFGVTHIDMPLTPQKIWSLCQETKAAGSGGRR